MQCFIGGSTCICYIGICTGGYVYSGKKRNLLPLSIMLHQTLHPPFYFHLYFNCLDSFSHLSLLCCLSLSAWRDCLSSLSRLSDSSLSLASSSLLLDCRRCCRSLDKRVNRTKVFQNTWSPRHCKYLGSILANTAKSSAHLRRCSASFFSSLSSSSSSRLNSSRRRRSLLSLASFRLSLSSATCWSTSSASSPSSASDGLLVPLSSLLQDSSSSRLPWLEGGDLASLKQELLVRPCLPLEVSGLCSSAGGATWPPAFGWRPTSCSKGGTLDREDEGLDWWRTSLSTLWLETPSLPFACTRLRRKWVVLRQKISNV